LYFINLQFFKMLAILRRLSKIIRTRSALAAVVGKSAKASGYFA